MNVGQNATDRFLKLPIVSSMDQGKKQNQMLKMMPRHVNKPNHHSETSAHSTTRSTTSHVEHNGNANPLK